MLLWQVKSVCISFLMFVSFREADVASAAKCKRASRPGPWLPASLPLDASCLCHEGLRDGGQNRLVG